MLKQKPYYLLFFFAFIMAVLSFVPSKEKVTINLYDTYYVVPEKQFYILLAFTFALVFLIYQLLEKLKVKLQNSITWLHVLGTILSVSAVLYFKYQNAQSLKIGHLQMATGFNAYNSSLVVALVILSLVQMFLLINIFVAVVKQFLRIPHR